jgi:acyl transferase domain-containing protein
MVFVGLPVDELAARVEPFGDRASVAAVNGPSSTVVSGDPAVLEELLAGCLADGVRARRIAVDYASHSPQVERIRERLLEVLAPIEPQPGDVPFRSAATGELLDTATLDAGYWYRSLRRAVHFERATRAILQQGCTTLIEVGPHPVLVPAIEETIEALQPDHEVAVLYSLQRGEDAPAYTSIGTPSSRRPVLGACPCLRTRSSADASGWNPGRTPAM